MGGETKHEEVFEHVSILYLILLLFILVNPLY